MEFKEEVSPPGCSLYFFHRSSILQDNMKSISVLLLLLAITRTVLSSQLVFASQDDDLEVPGENTLVYCNDPSDYIFNIDYLNYSPNPPEQGENLTITAAGISSQTIDVGAKLFIQVKLGAITLLRNEYDFCDVIDVVNLTCPLEKGYRKITKVVEIPSGVPAGTYSVSADAYTPEHENEITCLAGSIVF